MKSNSFQKFIGLVLISILSANSPRAGSLTDYGAIPQLTQPQGNQLDANQKLDFHTDLFTGRFGYQVPIAVPPARGGTEPGIALQYSSANKNGWCGVGWDLDMGYIQRETRYGVPISGGSYSDNYGFVFSIAGHSGRLVSMGSGNYYAQINADFLKFTYSGGTWTVTDKGGRKYYFGETTASRITTSFGTFKWELSSTLDPNGNRSYYTYTTDSGQLYLSKIDYNGNVNSPAIATNCAVVFDLGSRSDVISSAISGMEIRTAKLLTGIRVFSQGQQARRYALGYIASPSTTRALLQTVTQYGADNTTALPPLAFGYSVQQFGFTSPDYWPIVSQTSTGDLYGTSPATPDAQLIDINGDGLPDRVIHPYGQSYFLVQYNQGAANKFTGQYYWSPVGNETGDTTSPWMDLDSADSHMLDINGDGLPDRVINQHDPPRNHFQAQLNTGSGFAGSISDWNNVSSIYPNYEGYGSDLLNVPYANSSDGVSSVTTMADINGDGFPDRVTAGSAAGRFDVQLNTGGAFSSTILAWNNVYPSGIRTDTYYAPRARDNNNVYSDLIDMNGDGLPDRVIDSGSPNYIIEAQINNGVSGFGAPQSWNLSGLYPGQIDTPNGDYYIMMVDMNGDGLPDIVYLPTYGGGVYRVYFNTGTGFSSTPVTWSNVGNITGLGTGGDAMQAWDANGTRAEMIDMNGDGLPDRVMRCPNQGSGTDYLAVQYNLGPYPDLLVIATNGIGGSVNVTYQPSTVYRNPDFTPQKINFPVYVVTSVTANDSRGNSGTTSYNYSGAYYDTTYREFRGFYRVQETDPLGATTYTYFHQGGGNSWNGSSQGEYYDDIAKSGMPFRVENYGSDGYLYSITMNLVSEVLTYNGGGGFNNVYFPFIAQTLKLDYEANGSPRVTATGYSYYTATGNLYEKTDFGEVTGVNIANQTFTGITGTPPSVYRLYTYATIASNPDIVDKPQSITVSADSGGTTVLQQTLYQYFGVTGNLQQKSDLICPSTYATNSYTYDNYGNVATTTDPANIITTVNYDSTATFPARKYTGTLGNNLIEYSQYDPRSGALLNSTNLQGLVTANAYDMFFRLTNSATSTTPNGSPTLWRKRVQYNLGGIIGNTSSNYVRMLENDPADTVNGYHATYTYLDGLGRPIQTRVEAETNNYYRVSDLVYDSRGSVILEEYPFFATGSSYGIPGGTTLTVYTQYDPLGRVSAVYPCASTGFNGNGWVNSISTLTGDTGSPVGPTSIAYKDGSNPWAIIATDARGKIHKYYEDAFGRTNQIVEVTTNGNFTTTLNYNLVDNLTNIIDNAGNKISFFYDDLGRQVAITDPDMGFWQYGYDLDGRLKVQTDPKGQQIKFYYNDPAGRVTSKEGRNASSQLVSTNTWAYDSNGGDSSCTVYRGQLYKVTDDQGWQKFSYDVRNRTLKSTRYLSKNGQIYTNQFAFDDADRLTATIYPNGGPAITNIYDTGEHLLQAKQVGGTTFYAAKGFNALGQLNGVNFGNGVATTLGYYGVSKRLQQITSAKTANVQSLAYSYDVVGNISNVADGVYTGSASATLGNIQYDDLNRLTSATWTGYGAKSYAYNSIGNMTLNNESGSGAYNYGTARPHMVKSANGVTYTCDLNGNITHRGKQLLSYDVNNHLSQVTATNGIVTTFGYAGTGERLWESSGTNALQVWIGNNYEEKNGRILYHVYAGGRLVATFDKTGTNVFQYYHPDDLTSTSIQTDQNGNEIQNYEYSAFGQSRYTQSSTVFKVSRQYTSQVLDDATGLYYYNARYYDPILARFTQPDDTIPDLFNPQSYNRYSYCVNNPLRYTDPSGRQASEELDLKDIAESRGTTAYNLNSRGQRLETTAQRIQDSMEMENSAAAMRARGLDPSKTYFLAPESQAQAKPMTEKEFADSIQKTVENMQKLDVAGQTTAPKVLTLNGDKYPVSAANLQEAGAVNTPLTVNRAGADANRATALQGLQKIPGHDLDEAPPAMLRKSGDPVVVRPTPPADNRGAGASLGNQARDVPEGGKVVIQIQKKAANE